MLPSSSPSNLTPATSLGPSPISGTASTCRISWPPASCASTPWALKAR
ncbi:hypothetical protein ACFPM0_11780 [Pseudonocardia sulfidoxydans]